MKFEITSEDVGTLVGMLGEIPLKWSQPLLKHIQQSLTKVEPNVDSKKENDNADEETDAVAD